jgi:hypothetical protein
MLRCTMKCIAVPSAPGEQRASADSCATLALCCAVLCCVVLAVLRRAPDGCSGVGFRVWGKQTLNNAAPCS